MRMRICGISDIHGNLIENIPKCDILCICGDTINLNDQRNFDASKKWWRTRFVDWCKKLQCDKVIVIPGNHDFYLEKVYKDGDWEEFSDHMSILSNGKIVFLLDESYEYEGIMFYGTPWICPILYQENVWAFSSNKYYEDIPECDVLLTHENPFCNNILDYYSHSKYRKYHLYGHWHDGASDIVTGRYNCARLDDWYNFKKNYEFVVLDIMTSAEKSKVQQDFLNMIINEAKNTQPFIAEWLKAYKVTEIPQDVEDSIPWDTSAEVLESAIIDDIEE